MKRLLFLVALLFGTLAGHAQPSAGGPAPQPSAPTAVPLDGGATLMVTGGVAYGLRRLRARRAR